VAGSRAPRHGRPLAQSGELRGRQLHAVRPHLLRQFNICIEQHLRAMRVSQRRHTPRQFAQLVTCEVFLAQLQQPQPVAQRNLQPPQEFFHAQFRGIADRIQERQLQ
jgi:hypothetical protein